MSVLGNNIFFLPLFSRRVIALSESPYRSAPLSFSYCRLYNKRMYLTKAALYRQLIIVSSILGSLKIIRNLQLSAHSQ